MIFKNEGAPVLDSGRIFPRCRDIAGCLKWDELISDYPEKNSPAKLLHSIKLQAGANGLPDFLADLARLEFAAYKLTTPSDDIKSPTATDKLAVNPTLELLEVSWKNLPALIQGKNRPKRAPPPIPGNEIILCFRHPKSNDVLIRTATDEDLLALKIVVEELSAEEVAKEGEIPLIVVEDALERSVRNGILLNLPSRISRRPTFCKTLNESNRQFQAAEIFTLQWHITQACDLYCKHCYDRSSRKNLPLDKALHILDSLRDFVRQKNVRGQITFTGGNPLLYPDFFELYREAVKRGFSTAILGNPARREEVAALNEIQPPAFYQVSLEGLRDHNDYIRGAGHFDRVMAFLDVLRELGTCSMVMLTLTRDNMDQVLPLAELLRGKTDIFNFNRLAMVGEGANLQSPPPESYAAFLKIYLEAAHNNPCMYLKDNLINLVHYQQGMELFGGCTGFGCGAAFNFFSLLPDGEAHACRKFPSYIGNAFEQSISKIYDSQLASRYRSGSSACQSCPIRPACGGCLAVTHGFGLDVFKDRDPYCFLELD